MCDCARSRCVFQACWCGICGVRLRKKTFFVEAVNACEMSSWNCVVVCRRTRAGVDEVLVQWECSWIAADAVPQGEVVRTLLRRTVGTKVELLVQWACTWEPVEQVDAAAVGEYCGVVIMEDVVMSAAVIDGQAAVDRKPRIKGLAKRVRNRNW